MDNREIIAVTGTPGTGKSSVACEMASEWNYQLIEINSIIEDEGIYEFDENGTKLVDAEDLVGVLSNLIGVGDDNLILDGHLSHLLPSNLISRIVVLRTDPKVLKERLKRRGYEDDKLRENLESEALGVIMGEVLKLHEESKIYEINTTQMDSSEVLEILEKAFELGTHHPEPIDWLEEIMNMEDFGFNEG
ncbi:MAG: adenylate kinase family protein [Candidatus Hadarchaeota archaeon]